MDFRVQAQIGYYNTSLSFVNAPGAPFSIYTFNGEVSGWSSPQTITIPEGQMPTSPSATTPTPTPPNMGPTSPPTREPLLTPEKLEIVIVAAIAVAVIGAGLGLLIYLARRK